MNDALESLFCLCTPTGSRAVIAQSVQRWATGCTIGVLGFNSRRGLGIFLFTASRTALGPTQPPIQWVAGALSLGVKRPGREANHSPHLVPRSRKRGTIPPLPQYAFMVWCLVKHRDNFTFYLYTYMFSCSLYLFTLPQHFTTCPTHIALKFLVPPFCNYFTLQLITDAALELHKITSAGLSSLK
jgi:hypothetical protein